MVLPYKLFRKVNTHKGDYGHVLIIGGSLGLTGAVCLAAKSAMRSGAGLVTLGVPKDLNNIFEIKLTETMSLSLPSSKGCLSPAAFFSIKKFVEKIDCLVIGPGVSLDQGTRSLMRKIIKEVDRPMIIDADAITALAADLTILNKRKALNVAITPHLGEFSRLIKQDKGIIQKRRKELVKKFSKRYNLSLVLKGNKTIVCKGNKLIENSTGNPGMATAGSGDVLSGIIGAMVAQGLDVYEACKLAVYLHGLAGDYAVRDKGQHSLIASDIIESLPKAFKTLSK